jgi:hypothetical protein
MADCVTLPCQIIGKESKYVDVAFCVSAIKDAIGFSLLFVANVVPRALSTHPAAWDREEFVKSREELFQEFAKRAGIINNTPSPILAASIPAQLDPNP